MNTLRHVPSPAQADLPLIVIYFFFFLFITSCKQNPACTNLCNHFLELCLIWSCKITLGVRFRFDIPFFRFSVDILITNQCSEFFEVLSSLSHQYSLVMSAIHPSKHHGALATPLIRCVLGILILQLFALWTLQTFFKSFRTRVRTKLSCVHLDLFHKIGVLVLLLTVD